MTRLQNPRTWLAGGGVLAVLVVLVGYFAFISPQRDDTASVRAGIAAEQAQTDVLQQRLVFLARQNQNLHTFQAALTKARLALPASSAMPEFLQSLQQISNSTHTSLTGLTVGAPAAMTQSAAPAAGASTAPAAAAPATASAAPAAAAAGTGIYTVPISAQLSGTQANLAEFLRQLQSVQPRAVLVSTMTQGAAVGGSADGSSTTLSITMQAFIAPEAAPQTAQPSASPSSGG